MTGTAVEGEEGADAGNALPKGLVARLKSDPARAPQHLSLAAVERMGEPAMDYAAKVRAEHPSATPRQLAEVVKKRHALLARMEGATAGVPIAFAPVAGPGAIAAAAVTIIPDIATLAWIQSRMVIHIAAVYGHDTTDRDTAAELLVLQGFYNSTEAARVAVSEAAKRVSKRLINQYVKGASLQLLKQLFRVVGIKFTRAGLLRAVPLVSIPASAAVNEAATRSLANRALEFYDLEPRKV